MKDSPLYCWEESLAANVAVGTSAMVKASDVADVSCFIEWIFVMVELIVVEVIANNDDKNIAKNFLVALDMWYEFWHRAATNNIFNR